MHLYSKSYLGLLMKRVLIGVAWPYANGPIHIGQVSGCYLAPDIFRKYYKMKGREVLMVSGSDQHGTPVTVQAEKEGLSPKELADKYHRINDKALIDLGVEFDLFTYTMHSRHKEISQDIFKTLYDKDHIYLDVMETFYCSHCSRFLPDRYVSGTCPRCGTEEIKGDQCDECGLLLDPQDLHEPKCMFCGGEPELKESEHFFLRLSGFQEKLEEYLEDKDFWKNHVLNFSRGWLEEGLKDRPISRDMGWGIPVPVKGYEDKKIYVWFEAVIGYFSTSVQWAEKHEEDWETFWKDPDCHHYYFLGKDNIPFHTIIWPAILMGYDEELNLPYNVPANQYMKFQGEQFSTSRGVIVSLPDILEQFDADAVRYYITSVMPELRDSNFSWEGFKDKNNSELVGNLGNYIHRVLSFTYSKFGEVPSAGNMDDRDRDIIDLIHKTEEKVGTCIEECRFKDGLRHLLELSREGNRYFNDRAPWVEIKEDRGRCATTLNIALRIVKALSVIATPYLPHSMDELRGYLGSKTDWHEVSWHEALEPIEVGLKIEEPQPLYKSIDLDDVFPDRKILAGLETLDLRVGEIAEVKDHPDADKLYVLKVDLGEEQRTLVAGLKPYYEKDELQGKKGIVVANLEPAKLRGIESEGMLLAAEHEGKVSILRADGEPGDQVENTTYGAEEISFGDFHRREFFVAEFIDGKLQADEIYRCLDEEEYDGDVVVCVHDGNGLTLKVGGTPIKLDRKVPPGSAIK